jgi:hypothetical protein
MALTQLTNGMSGSDCRTNINASFTKVDTLGVISTPKVYYVETTGNDSTGAVGNPALPYATGTAAEAAGHAVGVYFVIQFGVGTFNITVSSRPISSILQNVSGRGNYATDLTVSVTPANVDSVQATDSPDLTIEANQCTLTANARGGTGTDSLEADGLNGGNGGDVIVTGDCKISNIDSSGGNGFGFTTPGNGGSAGTITINGRGCLVGGAQANAGSGSGGGSASHFSADNCDLRPAGGSITANTSTTTIGRCSYTGFTPTTDQGGNAAY